MFSPKNDENEKLESIEKAENKKDNESFSSYSNYSKYKTVSHTTSNKGIEMGMEDLEKMLETEKINNKSENWNKLDKTQKIQKLHQYAETYGKEKELPVNDVKSLKLFFKDSLNKNKLQKSKDIQYDKDKGLVLNVPSLFFNTTNRSYTLKNMDPKRVSTVKCLHKNKKEPPIELNK
tara:strand:+ start:979 stop:1509 length:531 start_codon:yes stop_codon:yes gene_type:complete